MRQSRVNPRFIITEVPEIQLQNKPRRKPKPNSEIFGLGSFRRNPGLRRQSDVHLGSKDSLVSGSPTHIYNTIHTTSSIKPRRNVRSLSRLDCHRSRVVSETGSDSKTPPSGRLDTEMKQKTLTELNQDLDTIFHTDSGGSVNNLSLPRSPPSYAVSRPVSRSSNFEESDPAQFLARRTSQDEMESPILNRSFIRRYQNENNASFKPVKSPMKLLRSNSRTYLEEPVIDELEVYHTISGEKANLMAASRTQNPFSKIMRRPANIVAGIPSSLTAVNKGVSATDIETETINGLSEDVWRVRCGFN